MTASGTAADYFGAMVASYDSLIRRAVPRYEEMTARLLEYLPPAAADVLELGCGTGNLSLALAARYPAAALTVVDASPEMVDVTRARLDAAGARARPTRCVVARFEALAAEPGAYDLITSCISLHHVRDKGALFRSLRAALRPGGTLCLADQMAGGSPRAHARNWSRWLAYCREPGHCTEAELQSLVDHASAHDHYESVAAHLAYLAAAGFTGIDCVWRDGMWGAVTGEA